MKTESLRDYKVKELQNQMGNVNATLEKIMTNHLPHINQDIISLKTRVTLMAGINILGIVVGIVAARILR